MGVRLLTPSWLVQSGSIFGAGLDVTDPDPADPDNPLLDMENVTVLPHMACAPSRPFAYSGPLGALTTQPPSALCLCSSALLLFVPLRPVDL